MFIAFRTLFVWSNIFVHILFDQYMQISSEKIDFKMFRRNMLDFLKPVSFLKIIDNRDEKILNQSFSNKFYSDTIVFLVKYMCQKELFKIRTKQRSNDDFWINKIYPELRRKLKKKYSIQQPHVDKLSK